MEQKVILFQGGTHGNFLTKYLNMITGYLDENFNFYGDNHGAHVKLDEEKSLFINTHGLGFDIEYFCYIFIRPNDLYKLHWHTFYAAGEFGLSVLDNRKDFEQFFYSFLETNSKHPVAKGNLSIKFYEKNKDGVREYFKNGFKNPDGFLKKQESILKNYKIKNYFYFEDFYTSDFDRKIKDNLGIESNIKTDHHEIFLSRKKDIIDSEAKVKSAVDAFLNNQYYRLEDFCLYEQAYFDHLIEEHYGITLKSVYKQYPTNTLEYVVQEDK